jgi:hypothetical protein
MIDLWRALNAPITPTEFTQVISVGLVALAALGVATGYSAFLITRSKHRTRRRSAVNHSRHKSPDWFSQATFLVPRQIREPWAGDLHEDRAKWARDGIPRWRIEVSTVGQVLLLLMICAFRWIATYFIDRIVKPN